MQKDFHYYATICASYIAGHTPEDSIALGYASQFTDCCTKMLLKMAGAPVSAATTQSQSELADARMDIIGLQDITRIWSSFHFLPRDLYADAGKKSKFYKNKFRLICGPNGPLVADTVKLAKDGSLQAIGIAMHVLADTWAHMYFAGTPSQVINNTDSHFYEEIREGDGYVKKPIAFRHNPLKPDDLDDGNYTNSLHQSNESAIMNLGHGRAGHLPDYSFIRYRYLPAWMDYKEMVKDNPSDYYKAFCQMVYALKYLRGDEADFVTDTYATEEVAPIEEEIREIIGKRRLDACDDWKALGEKLSGEALEPFERDRHVQEYLDAAKEEKDDTFLGRFIHGALAHKSMVTNRIFKSGNRLAGVSVEYAEHGLKGIRAYYALVKKMRGEKNG